MDDIEKLTALLKSKEGQEIMSKHIKNFIEKQKIEEEEINKILSNTDYINWIINFLADNDSFSDYCWLYNSLNLKDIDVKNLKKLSLFYDGVDKYANENFIYPTNDNNGSFYQIKYNDWCFEIGVIYGQGTTYYCQKAYVKEDKYIDFNDILNNRKQDNISEITDTLKLLSECILDAYNKGVPIEAIKNTTDKVINDIIWQKKDKSKIKVKK